MYSNAAMPLAKFEKVKKLREFGISEEDLATLYHEDKRLLSREECSFYESLQRVKSKRDPKCRPITIPPV